MKIKKNSLILKSIVLFLVIMGLQLPVGQVMNLVNERSFKKESVSTEIEKVSGSIQKISGPLIIVRGMVKSNPESSTISANQKSLLYSSKAAALISKENWFVLPEDQSNKVNVEIETLKRGMFSFNVFHATNSIAGLLNLTKLASNLKSRNFKLEGIWLIFSISDSRFLDLVEDIKFNKQQIIEEPQILHNDDYNINLKDTWIKIKIPDSALNILDPVEFSFKIKLRGSEELSFSSFARSSELAITTNSSNVKFNGDLLPIKRKLTENSAEGIWKISSYAQKPICSPFCNSAYFIDDSYNIINLGIKFLQALDTHSIVYRSVKYYLLFLLLTFAIYLVSEVLDRILLHPIQYVLVGLALTIFYLLLLSFSEHLGFTLSYVVAALVAIILITGYSIAILKSRRKGLSIGVALSALYVFLYSVLVQQDYALLNGSLGIVVILGSAMYLTRNINWYTLTKDINSLDDC
jgi:inner membrane protein